MDYIVILNYIKNLYIILRVYVSVLFKLIDCNLYTDEVYRIFNDPKKVIKLINNIKKQHENKRRIFK